MVEQQRGFEALLHVANVFAHLLFDRHVQADVGYIQEGTAGACSKDAPSHNACVAERELAHCDGQERAEIKRSTAFLYVTSYTSWGMRYIVCKSERSLGRGCPTSSCGRCPNTRRSAPRADGAVAKGRAEHFELALVGTKMPVSIFRVVDFPAPFSPIKPTRSRARSRS